jgi:hypothetical protein
MCEGVKRGALIERIYILGEGGLSGRAADRSKESGNEQIS